MYDVWSEELVTRDAERAVTHSGKEDDGYYYGHEWMAKVNANGSVSMMKRCRLREESETALHIVQFRASV